MRKYSIPISRPRTHEASPQEVNDFFNIIASVPDEYLKDIVDGFSPDYIFADRESRPLLTDYVENRLARNDLYFKTIEEIKLRLYNGKPIILIKK